MITNFLSRLFKPKTNPLDFITLVTDNNNIMHIAQTTQLTRCGILIQSIQLNPLYQDTCLHCLNTLPKQVLDTYFKLSEINY